MLEQARGLSFVHYTYEGGPLRFTPTFPFLKREHVRVLVGDPASPRVVLGTWINSTTIEIPDQSQFLTAPFDVTLRRVTPIDQSIITFQGGAMLPDSHLNAALKQLLYAHQELRDYPVGSSGNPGGGVGIIDIQTIIDLVTQSPAFLILQERIPEVDSNAELIMGELLRSNSYFDLHRDHGTKISTAYTRIELTETATEVLAQQYTELFARVVTAELDVAAQFLQVNTAVANETSARVTALTELHAQITTDTGTLVAQAVSNVMVEVDEVESRVETVEGAVATHGDQIAAANTALTVVSNAAGANTDWRQLFSSTFGIDPNSGGALAAAAVKTQIDTKVDAAGATSIANTSVTAFANGTFAALQNSYTAYVSANDGKWSSTWSLRINGGNPANPIIAGVALGADPTGSSFVVQADKFAIVSPTDYATKKIPFVVGTVGGVSTVGITGALLVDGSITANKLTVTSLSAVTANAGTLNGGTFKTHTLDGSGNVIDATEFRVELSNTGTWPMWVGAGVKNENNAVFWLDRLGNAAFKGKVSAPNIVGQFQQATAVTWTGATTLSTQPTSGEWVALGDFQQITTFTLGAPLLVGETHTPCINLVVNYSDDTPGAIVCVDEMRASVWVEICRWEAQVSPSIYGSFSSGIDTYSYGLHKMPCMSKQAILIGTGQATASSRQFRIRAMYRDAMRPPADANPGPFFRITPVNVTSISGYVFGVR